MWLRLYTQNARCTKERNDEGGNRSDLGIGLRPRRSLVKETIKRLGQVEIPEPWAKED